MKSPIWFYFVKDDKDYCKCKYYGKRFKLSCSSTSNMHRHLKSRHGINFTINNGGCDTKESKSDLETNSGHTTLDKFVKNSGLLFG